MKQIFDYAGVGVLLAVVAFCFLPKGKSQPTADDGTMAEIMAEKFVKQELRCLATASFSAADAKRSADG